MRISRITLGAMFASVLHLSAVSHVSATSLDIRNGSFEFGLQDWDTIGVAGTGCCFNASNKPTDGRHAATLIASSSFGVSQSALESFLELPSAKLSTLNQDRISNGSAISQIIAINANRTLSFDFDFGIFSGTIGDFAFFSIAKEFSPGVFFDSYVEMLANTSSQLTIPPSLTCPPNTPQINCPPKNQFPETGFLSFKYPVFETGIYRIGIGVSHADRGIQSALIVDNVRLIPEPSTFMLLGLAVALMAASGPFTRFSSGGLGKLS